MVTKPSLAPAEAPTQETPLEQVRASLELPDTAAAEEETPEPQAEPGEEPEEQEQPEQELTLPEGWEEYEPVLERLKAAESTGYNKAKSHLTRAHTATIAELQETHQGEIQQAQQEAISKALVQTFAEKIGELDTDDPDTVKTVTRLLHANESWARVFYGDQYKSGQANLVNAITNDSRFTKDLQEEVADEFNATVTELALKLRRQLSNASSTADVSRAYSTAFGSWLEERDKLRAQQIVKAALDKEGKRLEEVARKAAGLENKAGQRNNSRPPAKPTGSAGGGGTYRTLDEARVLHADGKITNDEMRSDQVRFEQRG